MNKKLTAAPVFLVFLCMGFGDVVGPLVSLAKDSFSLSNFMAALLPASGFVMFGILSIPVGVYQDRKGKKRTLITGLLIAFIGLLIPVINGMHGKQVDIGSQDMSKFYMLLGSILFLGTGAAILQVSGNPIMRDVSPEGRYSSNLSLAQGIKAIGSSLGFLLPPVAAIAFGLEWTFLFPVYSGFMLITLVWILATRITEKKESSTQIATVTSCFRLMFGNRYVTAMVLAIFLYVGAEVSMSAQVPILMKDAYGIETVGLIISWLLFFLPILIGRFTGAALLRRITPINFLLLTVLISLGGIILLLLGNMFIAFTGIVLVGLGFANIFPLIFSITIDELPERSNELSGLMVFAIVGGAFIPVLTGALADLTSLLTGFLVPLSCIVYIGFIAVWNRRRND